MRFFRKYMILLIPIFLAAAVAVAEETTSDIQLDVETFQLDNGMQFLIVERHVTPQVACRVAVRAGSANEETGKTGIAHLLEHMMFKGTKNFGTLDLKRDQKLQKKIEAAYQVVLAEKKKRNPDQGLIEEKLKEMEDLRGQVQEIYVPQAFSSQLAKNGAVGINAFTSLDQTQYVMSIPSDMIEQWFSIVSEQLFEPSWREFYVEKEVVQREWAFRYVNNPKGAAWLDLFATAFTAHPYRNPVIGWKSDMENFNTTDAMAFHNRYYNPTNAVCVLVGDVTVERAELLARIYFARYPAGIRAPEVVTEEPSHQGPRKSVRFLKGTRTPLIRIGYHGPEMGTKDFYALDVLTMVMSSGRSARVKRRIVDQGLAVEAWTHNLDNRYGGFFILGGSPNEPRKIKDEAPSEEEKHTIYVEACEALEKTLLGEIEKIKSEGVTEAELARVKKLNRRDFLDSLRSNEKLARMLATLEVQVGWRYLITYLEKIDEVTTADVKRAAEAYLSRHSRSTVFVIPGGAPDRSPEPYTESRSGGGRAGARVVRPESLENHSIYPTVDGWKHPLSFEREPQQIQYPDARSAEVKGVPVFYLPDDELPLIDLSILVKAGGVDVDDSKIGLPTILTGSVIRGGTETLSPSELAKVLDENAIRLSIAVGEEQTEISLSVMKDDWERGLELMEEVLTRPGFDQTVLEVIKRQALTALERQGEDAQSVSQREAMIRHFKGHPYGRDPLRGLETIPNITRDDLAGFMRAYFVAPNMVVAVAGDIELERAHQGLRELFQALPEGAPNDRSLDEPPRTTPMLALIHKPGQVQSQIMMLLRGVQRIHPAYWKMSLLMEVFGGNDSLLYTRLRDDLGLVYAAGFFQTYKWKAGLLMGYIGCRGDMTAGAIRETVDIMRALQGNIPQRELEQKRLDALNSFVFNVDTPHELVEVYARYHLRNEPLDTLEKIQKSYIEASKGGLEALARKFLIPGELQITVVADKNIPVAGSDGETMILERGLINLAAELGLPFEEIPLR